jgi:diphosphomevalonate decarboxylase
MTVATAEARSNIALVKYWGKRDAALNLPAAGSLSLTLDELRTRTRVEVDPMLAADRFVLAGQPQEGEALARVSRFLDLVRALAGAPLHASVDSDNNFPTASGLASSASAFAALAAAAARAYGLPLPPARLSALARRGSGSAARSIFGGFVLMAAGDRDEDAVASPLLAADAWDVRLVVAVVGGGAAKEVGSRRGMDHTTATSPLYAGWLSTVDDDLAAARAAIERRDLAALGEVAERSALTMHASAMAARPGVIYFRGATVEALHAVRRMRGDGVVAYATIDAGPHVKVLTTPGDAETVAATLRCVEGVSRTILCRPGPGVEVG